MQRRPREVVALLSVVVTVLSCGGSTSPTGASTPSSVAPSASATIERTPTPLPSRLVHLGYRPISTGEPIGLSELSGRIVFDDFEDVFVMDVDGSNVVAVADQAGSEFDGDLSPDGRFVAYRDSTRGINEDDEIFVVPTDGSDPRNITRDPANDWGPAWSPDGSTIAFNSDRDGGALRGYLVDPDGSNVRAIDIDAWVEYPSFSPDATRIAFMGHHGGGYDIFVAELESGATTQLTDSPGSDGWPVWSPDGESIAFTSERDDCAFQPVDEECWDAGPEDEHRDVWLMDADGGNQHRVTPEISQFAAWSPAVATSSCPAEPCSSSVRTGRAGWSCEPTASTCRSAASPTGVDRVARQGDGGAGRSRLGASSNVPPCVMNRSSPVATSIARS